MQKTVIQPVIPGLLLCFTTILFGIGAGLTFGIAGHDINVFLQDGIEWRLDGTAHSTSNVEAETSRSWHYLQQAYVHAQGLGALGVGITLTLALLKISPLIKGGLSFAIGLGAMLYPGTLFLSALATPTIGLQFLQPTLDWLISVSLPLFFGGSGLALLILLLVWVDPGLFIPTRKASISTDS